MLSTWTIITADKVCSTNDDEHRNVESSLLILFIKYTLGPA